MPLMMHSLCVRRGRGRGQRSALTSGEEGGSGDTQPQRRLGLPVHLGLWCMHPAVAMRDLTQVVEVIVCVWWGGGRERTGGHQLP